MVVKVTTLFVLFLGRVTAAKASAIVKVALTFFLDYEPVKTMRHLLEIRYVVPDSHNIPKIINNDQSYMINEEKSSVDL